MKIKTSCLLILLFALCCCSDDDDVTVEVLNDKIEKSTSWQFVKVGSADHAGAVAQDAFVSPDYCLAIESISTTTDTDAFSFWRYALSPSGIPVGSSLTLKVKIKTVNVSDPGIYFALRGDKGTSNGFFVTTQGSNPVNGTSDFTEQSVTLQLFPEGITNMYIFLILDGKSEGKVYFDDITLTNVRKK